MSKNLKLIHGGGEIKRITPQIKMGFNILNGTDISGVRYSPGIIEKMIDLGFSKSISSGIAFIGDTQVIKCGLLTRRPPPIKYRVPTLIYSYVDIKATQWELDYVLMIQPKVDEINCFSDNIIEKVEKKFNRLTDCDVHVENYGRYKGDILLFDW